MGNGIFRIHLLGAGGCLFWVSGSLSGFLVRVSSMCDDRIMYEREDLVFCFRYLLRKHVYATPYFRPEVIVT